MSYKKPKKNEKIINQKSLVDMLSVKSGFTKKDIQIVLNDLEEIIQVNLSQANEKENVRIKLMPGISIEAEYQPDRIMTDPRNGQNIVVKEKLMVRVKVLESIKDKVNEMFTYKRSLLKR